MSNLLGVNADAIEVEESGAQETLIAPGLHPAVITHIEEGTTRNGNAYVDYHFTINGGVNQGASVRNREWPDTQSDVAKNIYNKKLKALLTICGVVGPLNSLDQLCGIQLLINNKPRPRSDDVTKMQNNINYYERYDATAKLASAQSMNAAPTITPAVQQQVQVQPIQVAQAQPQPQGVPQPPPQGLPTMPVNQQMGVVPQAGVMQGVVQGVPQPQAGVPQGVPQPQQDFNDAIPR